MKKMLIAMAVLIGVAACNPNTNEGGAINDGIKAVDSNGAFDESAPNENQVQPGIDTSRGENRVDIQSRDSVNIGQ